MQLLPANQSHSWKPGSWRAQTGDTATQGQTHVRRSMLPGFLMDSWRRDNKWWARSRNTSPKAHKKHAGYKMRAFVPR
jgi:hypothetical protein